MIGELRKTLKALQNFLDASESSSQYDTKSISISPFRANPELLHVRWSLRFRIGVSIFELFCWQKEFGWSFRLSFWLLDCDGWLELSLRVMIWFIMMSRPLTRWYVERSRPRIDVRFGPGAKLIRSSSPRMSLFIARRISNERGVRIVGGGAAVGLGVVVASACSVRLWEALLSIRERRADAPEEIMRTKV